MDQNTAITTTPSKPAPRRSRKRWYWIGGFILLVLAAPFLFSYAAGWWSDRVLEGICRGIDEEDPNWRWPDLVAEIEVPADDRNSVVQVKKIQTLEKKKPFAPGAKWDNASPSVFAHSNARLAPEYVKLLRDAFAVVDPELLNEARKLKDMPHGGLAIEPVDNPFFDIKLDYVQETRNIARLLQCDAILRGYDGDHDGAIDSCRAILNTGRSFKGQPFLISLLVRIAEQQIALAAIERALGQGEVSEENLKALQELLEKETADDGFHLAMRGERAGGHQMYVMVRERKLTISELLGGGRGGAAGGPDQLIDLFPGFIVGGYPDYLRLMNEQVRASKLKDVERAEAMSKIEDKVRKNRSLLSRLIMPATNKVAEASHRSQALLRCAAAGVAVERYRLKHNGDWPASLEEVVKAGLLKEIAKDPYDGKPLRAKRTPTGFIVYSIGRDLADNGGKIDRTNMLAPGSDLGFELWNAPELRGVAPAAELEK